MSLQFSPDSTYLCMIPHSLIFSFNLAHFGLKQNPTGLQEAFQRSDKNLKTTLIIKYTLEKSFLMKKHQKNHFWDIALFTRFNLDMRLYHNTPCRNNQTLKDYPIRKRSNKSMNNRKCNHSNNSFQGNIFSLYLERKNIYSESLKV